jgi:histidine triad (HIT) family protein
MFDIDDNLLRDYIVFAKKIAKAIKKTIPCQRVGMSVIGLEVPHAHIHLIPLDDIGDMNFSNEKLKFTEEEFMEIAAGIASNLE